MKPCRPAGSWDDFRARGEPWRTLLGGIPGDVRTLIGCARGELNPHALAGTGT
jgi:hypothetical protein